MNDLRTTPSSDDWKRVFTAFLKLGLTSFGGPVAHIGYFRREFVEQRRWLSENRYADLVALCQFLPGPASSQVGIGLGYGRAGTAGALAAWLGFTLPSAIAMILFAYGVVEWSDAAHGEWLHGLKVVAVAVVAQAVWGMARSLCPDRTRATLAILAAALTLSWASAWGQVAAILLGGLYGWQFLKTDPNHTAMAPAGRSSVSGPLLLLFFFALLLLLPLMASRTEPAWIDLVDSFYRSGSLVFGGGHVVLPLLQAEVVPSGWLDHHLFVAGYGAAQAVPGPLFTFSAYLGSAMTHGPGGWLGGLLCLLAVFAPSFLLVLAVLPHWERLRARAGVQSALTGVNAVVVGLLLAALYQPVWTSGIRSVEDFILGLAAFGLLQFWKTPPWLVVALAGVAGAHLAG